MNKNKLKGKLKLVKKIKYNGKTQEYVFQINRNQLSDYVRTFCKIGPAKHGIVDSTDYRRLKEHPTNDVYIIRTGYVFWRDCTIHLNRDGDPIQVMLYSRQLTYYCDKRTGETRIKWADALRDNDLFELNYKDCPAYLIDEKGSEIELESIIAIMDKYCKLSEMEEEEAFVKKFFSWNKEVKDVTNNLKIKEEKNSI